jgi:hypothetical protein
MQGIGIASGRAGPCWDEIPLVFTPWEKEGDMAFQIGGVEYTPGTYGQKRKSVAEMAGQYIQEWDQRRLKGKVKKVEPAPAICFSRKIGVGALEIAEIVAPRIGYRVVDREILEYISGQAELSEKTVAMFDERYRGRVNEFLALAFGEKAFIKSDYTRNLFSAAVSIAGLAPTLFVGRGIHLLLPRDRVLAVRFIGSDAQRIRRLSGILGVTEEEVEQELPKIDREQHDFFRSVYGKKDASAYEFDLVINCDMIHEPAWAAGIVVEAFREKYGDTSSA